MHKKTSLIVTSVVMAVGLITSSIAVTAAIGASVPAPSSSEAVLVKAEGNTTGTAVTGTADGSATIELAAVYPWGYYTTQAKCRTAGANFMKQYPGRFLGYWCVKGTGANSNKWQLYMNENDCTDRVSGTTGIGAAKEEI
ncbi:hypothetical protein [Rathayibacter sp. Leaf296]|uniref:hypothetical protein n=1 Tax=Rathayibacter sp. Leaf296 TaxID=1736327 RepID=UPI000703499D|nr:hypothetical protein [Rathayibacter sp. Leaf296]KQQ07514.1 hypothetical protein ASF46_17850 [Rathayibacter sp. Leaf296]